MRDLGNIVLDRHGECGDWLETAAQAMSLTEILWCASVQALLRT